MSECPNCGAITFDDEIKPCPMHDGEFFCDHCVLCKQCRREEWYMFDKVISPE